MSEPIPANPTSPLLSDALAAFLELRSTDLADSTLNGYGWHLGRWIRDIGDRPVREVTHAVMEPWMVCAARTYEASTYNQHRCRLNVFFDFCRRRGWLVGDPLEEFHPRRVHKRHRLRLTAEQLRLLYETAPYPRDRGMLALAACTGLRASDLSALTIGDVNLATSTLRVCFQKTGGSDYLPLALEANIELRDWLTEYARRMSLHGRRLEPTFLLFPRSDLIRNYHDGVREEVGSPLPEVRLAHPEKIVHAGLRRIGFVQQPGEGFHTIRRSVARLVFDQASEAGHDAALRLTAAMLGHSSTAITEEYLGVNIDRSRRDEFIRGRRLLGTPANRPKLGGSVVSLSARRPDVPHSG